MGDGLGSTAGSGRFREKSLASAKIRTPDRLVCTESLYQIRYSASTKYNTLTIIIVIIIIIIIIIIIFLTSQLWLGNIHLSWDAVINRIGLGGLICSLKSFLQLNMCQELQIFAFVYICICVYVLGCKLSLVRLCDSDFGITPVDDITIGTTCAAFCFHIAHISFASSWYLFCLSVIVFARLRVFGTDMSIKTVFFVFLFIKVTSGQLKGIVLSVSMLRFQYSLIFSFSSTLAGVYL